jgi:CheY-like chemotaxis protein
MKNSDESLSVQKKVAILEESGENIYSMKFILQSLGYHVQSFAAREGLMRELAAFSPGVIVVDMLMSGGRGLALISEVKRSAMKKIAIVAVTADAVPFSEEQLRKAGANDLLVKPYTVADLQETLAKHLEQQ